MGTQLSSHGSLTWLTPKIHALPHDVKFGSSASKGVCINRRKPQNWGALGPRPLAVGTWLSL